MDNLITAFDSRQVGSGPPIEVKLASTILDWRSLDVDPYVIRENANREKQRFEPTSEVLSSDPIAVVAYGPSLADTWTELRNFKHIITCSGAHRFLLAHDIVPTHHVESDPRIHKADMLGEPDKRVEYLVASICHPRYFYKLRDCNVKLWHLLFQDRRIYNLVDKGEWLLTGGNTVGPRAIKIARLLGFTNLHMFGFDGSGKHAASHLNPPPERKYRECHYHGKTFQTTEHLFTHVELLFQDLNYIPDATFEFHGEGLIQEIAKDWRYDFKAGYPLAVVKDD